MRILFMGTAAAEGVPSIFCTCELCEYARTHKGKDIRRRASTMINDDLLIDLGPDLFNFAAENGMFLGNIRYTLQTHPHEDHLDPLALFSRSDGTMVRGVQPMTWYLSAPAIERINQLTYHGESRFRLPEEQKDHHLDLVEIAPWQEHRFGDYRVQTVAANHDGRVLPMLFAIEEISTGARFFYGTDTGPVPEGTWQRLADHGWTFDVFMLDHTIGWGPRGGGHLNQEQFREEIAAARACGLIGDDTRVIANHFAHHSHPPHEEFIARAAAVGYEPAYDGMCVEIR